MKAKAMDVPGVLQDMPYRHLMKTSGGGNVGGVYKTIAVMLRRTTDFHSTSGRRIQPVTKKTVTIPAKKTAKTTPWQTAKKPLSHENELVVTSGKGNHFSGNNAKPRVALSVAGGAAGKNNAKVQQEV